MSEPTFNRPLGPVTLAELSAGLVWPKLLRAVALSVRPRRLILGTLVALLLWASAWLLDFASAGHFHGAPRAVLDDLTIGLASAAGHLTHLEVPAALDSLWLAATAFSAHWDQWPAVVLLWLVWAPIWVVGVGALCRSAALDIAGDFDLTNRGAIGFAMRRFATLLGAVLIPLGFAAVVSLVLRAAGFVFLVAPGVSVVGAIGYPLAWLGGLVLTLVFVGYALGKWLLIPAVAADGADATDAVQRAYSYVLSHPLRTVIYLAVLLVEGALAFAVIAWLVRTADEVARQSIISWLPAGRAGALGTPSPTASVMDFWSWMLGVLVGGWAISYYASASTLGYLLVRRVNDHQDEHEVWMPGAVGAVVSSKSSAS